MDEDFSQLLSIFRKNTGGNSHLRLEVQKQRDGTAGKPKFPQILTN